MVERCPDKTEAVGPIPTTPTLYSMVSQGEVRRGKTEVKGPIPSSRAIRYQNQEEKRSFYGYDFGFWKESNQSHSVKTYTAIYYSIYYSIYFWLVVSGNYKYLYKTISAC